MAEHEKKLFEAAPGMTHKEKMQKIGEAYTVAYTFATKVYETFPGLIKSIVLFGSIQKATFTRSSDIDVMVVVDDTALMPTRTFIDWYNMEIAKLIQKIDPRLHVNNVTLTTFWENVKVGEPVVINVLRYGVSLIDTGFFEPIQMLLRQGRIRPTEEAIYNALTRVPGHLLRATGRMLGAVVDFYWAMIDSAHAALMKYGKVPPSPEHVEKMLVDTFVYKKMLDKKYINYYTEIWKTSKAIIHGELLRIGGTDFDRYKFMTEDFENQMRKLIEKKG
jgi:predicted nucleotidyltransferase/uncharacterized protein (UPF0332 family)